MNPLPSTLTALCVLVAPLQAQPSLTLNDLKRVVGVGGVVLSPDGSTAVISVSRPSFERNRNESDLHAVAIATGARRQLTFDRRGVGGARFSPDGKWLGFLAPDSAGKAQ
ncbi:MAG: hypothetical protein SFV24_26220, partial [Gemmatimonadales bacterium]|nr:hypothetical protein [Gemmatimonadales bacterium]